jgi:hypothetical protein
MDFRLMASGKYTDLHIHCANVTFEAHRAVICSRSTVIANFVDVLTPDVCPITPSGHFLTDEAGAKYQAF